MKKLLAAVVLLLPYSTFAEAPSGRYNTTCVVFGGRAVGTVHSRDAFSFSGKVWFYYYDAEGNDVGKDWTIAAMVLGRSARQSAEVSAIPFDARSCNFDISEVAGPA